MNTYVYEKDIVFLLILLDHEISHVHADTEIFPKTIKSPKFDSLIYELYTLGW